MPLECTFGSFSTDITRGTEPVGGYYFGSKSMPFNEIVYIGASTYVAGKSTTNLAYISKTDENNKLLWTVTLGSTGITTEFINIVTYNDYLYVFGYALDTGNYYPIFAKYDTDGNLIWQKTINLVTTYQCMMSGTVDTSGNMYMALQTTLRVGAVTLANIQSDASTCRVLKIIEDGSISWQTQLGYNKYIWYNVIDIPPDPPQNLYFWRYDRDIYPIKIQSDSSGNIYMLCKYGTATGSPASYTSPPPTPTSLVNVETLTTLVIKISNTGNVLWQNEFIIRMGDPNVITDLLVDTSNNVYICGREFTAVVDSTPYFLKYNGGFIIKIEPNLGQMIWHIDLGPNLYNGTYPGDNRPAANWTSIASDGQGNLYVSGTSFTAAGSSVAVLFKLIDPGNTTPTGVVFANQNDVSNEIDLLRGKIYINNGTIISSWPINGGLPASQTYWPTLPLTYGRSFADLIVYDMTGGSNPSSYWRVLVRNFTVGGGTSLSSSASTFSPGTMSPGQTIVYYK